MELQPKRASASRPDAVTVPPLKIYRPDDAMVENATLPVVEASCAAERGPYPHSPLPPEGRAPLRKGIGTEGIGPGTAVPHRPPPQGGDQS